MKSKSIPIVEIFHSIQGEGPRTRPAIFVRTGLCSLTCKGFGCHLKAPDGTEVIGCDTIRAVSPKFKSQWTTYRDYNDLVAVINTHIHNGRHGQNIQDIIFTGGEPLLHWNTEIMQNTISYYQSRNHRVCIETNATLPIEFSKPYQEEDRKSTRLNSSHWSTSRMPSSA